MTTALSPQAVATVLDQSVGARGENSLLDPQLSAIVMLSPNESQVKLLAAILSRGKTVLVAQPLEVIGDKTTGGTAVGRLAGTAGPRTTLILGNFPDGFPAGGAGETFLDIGSMDEQMIVDAVEMVQPAEAAVQTPHGSDSGAPWLPWFPVIDYSRCSNCGQCRNFCLFGVYGQRDGKVAVVNPAHCKPHCPACARVCPRCAIMFPKYTEEPINGAEVQPGHLKKQVHPTDLSAMMHGDVQEMLRQRQEMEKALRERSDCSSEKPENK